MKQAEKDKKENLNRQKKRYILFNNEVDNHRNATTSG